MYTELIDEIAGLKMRLNALQSSFNQERGRVQHAKDAMTRVSEGWELERRRFIRLLDEADAENKQLRGSLEK